MTRFPITRAAALALALVLTTAASDQTDAPRFSRFTYTGHSDERVTVAPGGYRNPILSGYYPDPSVTRVGDDYYLVNSSFAHFPGLPVFHSKDLVHWTQIGNAIDRPGQLDYTGRRTSEAAFAPNISYHAGTFYIVNTCVACKGNFVITATDPAGPWSDPVWLPFEGIDPSIYWEGERAWIVNNRAPSGTPRYEGHRALWLQEFDWRTGRMIGEATQLVDGGVNIEKKPVWIEGPHILRKDGWYYLTAAEGGTAVDHSQVVFRARQLRGPYLPYAGNPILTQRDLDPARPHPITSAGHAKLVQTQNGDWWATFLAVRPYEGDRYNIGRETFLLPVTWRDGWPVILPRGRAIPFTDPAPKLPASTAALPTSGDFAYVDEFDGDRLALPWIGIRTPRRPFYRVAGGDLILGRGTPIGDLSGAPAFVARRQQHANATVTTTLRFTPGAPGARAGLAAVQSDRNYLFYGITRIGDRSMVALYVADAGHGGDGAVRAPERLVASAPIATDAPVTLTIRVTGGTMAFDFQGPGGRRTLAKGVDARFLSTQAAGGFVGTLIGPYAWAPR
jgi:alpha-N-arabinofuranosidase